MCGMTDLVKGMLCQYISDKAHKYNHVYSVGYRDNGRNLVQLVSLENASQRFNVSQDMVLPYWLQLGDVGYFKGNTVQVVDYELDFWPAFRLFKHDTGEYVMANMEELKHYFRHE
jgi:hypothetical protein